MLLGGAGPAALGVEVWAYPSRSLNCSLSRWGIITILVRLLAARLIDAVCGAAFDARRIASPLASHWPAGLQVLLVSRVCACSCSVSSRVCAVAAVAGGARGTGCRGMGLPVGLLACSERAQCLGICLPLALSEYFPIAIPTLRCNVIEQKWLVTGLGFLPITFTKQWCMLL